MVLAVVRVRGRRNIKPKIKHTLKLLKLEKVNQCVIIKDNAYFRGMLKIVKDYVTFGPISEETLKRLIEKRGRKGKTKIKNVDEVMKIVLTYGTCSRNARQYINATFRLKPPSKGYKNIKQHYPIGDLGKRENMDELLRRMI